MDSPLKIERVRPTAPTAYFSQMAEIHCAEIDTGFLTQLGPRFLRNLYREIARSRDAFLFSAVQGRQVVGFIVGSTDTRRVYRQYLLRRGLLDAWRVLPKLATRERITSVIETLRYPSRHQSVSLPGAEILNFCVRAAAQRMGIGKRLFRCLTEEFERRGVSQIRIVTGAQQVKAQRFYESLGATQAANLEIHRGRQSIAYVYDVVSEGAAQAA
jgi:ribosomal protein S18 acetylase RimI-like enzyme